MPRLFTALDLPEAPRQAIQDLRRDLRGARWTPPDNLHLTLRFFGEVDEARAAAIEERLGEVTGPPPALQSTGLIVLPSRRHPRVLAVAFERAPMLLSLHEQIEENARALNFEPETRRFRPHVTFARLKRTDREAVVHFLRTEGAPALSFVAKAFHLYESVLHPGGARHRRRATFELKP